MTIHHDKLSYGKFNINSTVKEDSLDEMVKILNGGKDERDDNPDKSTDDKPEKNKTDHESQSV